MEDIDNEEIKGLQKESMYMDRLPRGYLSISQVGQYQKCGMAYYYRYIEEVPVPTNSFMAQGTAVHGGAEKLHLSLIDDMTPPPLGYIEAAYEGKIDELLSNPDLVIMPEDVNGGHIKDIGIDLMRTYYAGALGECKDLGEGATGNYRPIYPVAAERVVRTMLEIPDAEPVPFLGVIDLEEVDGVADLKVKRKMGPQGETDNSLQLSLYAHVTKKKKVRLDQLIKPSKKLATRYLRRESTRTDREIAHALQITSETAIDISKGRFRLTMPDSWWCSKDWCPYWSRCRGKQS